MVISFGRSVSGGGIIGGVSYPPGYCVCGQRGGPHDCTGDQNHPAVRMLVDAMFAVHACAQCGTEDETVARGGTALCSYCQELSVYQARDEDKRQAQNDAGRLERHARRAQALLIAAVLVAAVAVWVAAIRA